MSFTGPNGGALVELSVTIISGRDISKGFVCANGETTKVGDKGRNNNYNFGETLSTLGNVNKATETLSDSFYVEEGTYLTLFISGKDDNATTSAKDISIKIYSEIIGKGLFLSFSNNTYSLIKEKEYRKDVLYLTSPSWNTENNLNYVSGTDFYNSYSTLTFGISTPCSGTLSIKGGGYPDQTVNPIFVTRGANSITFQMSNGEFIAVEKWGGQTSSKGVYEKLSCSITTIGQLSAVKFNNLLPKTSSATIGQDSNRIGSIFATTIYGRNLFGQEQTWQNVLSSRSEEINYTNTTGKTILVAVNLQTDSNSSQVYLRMYVDGQTMVREEVTNTSGTTSKTSGLIVVPSGSTYRVSAGGGDTFNGWYEYR